MGGDDSPQNLVKLTPEEHYLAHQLLVKIHPENSELIYAAQMMTIGRTTNKLYGWLRRRWVEENRKQDRSGRKNSQFGTRWITNGIENRKISKSEAIPLGWRKGRHLGGRKLTRKLKKIACAHCGNLFDSDRTKFCSRECRRAGTSAKRGSVAKAALAGKARTIETRKRISDGMVRRHFLRSCSVT